MGSLFFPLSFPEQNIGAPRRIAKALCELVDEEGLRVSTVEVTVKGEEEES